MRTLQTRDIPKYLLAALATGIILLAAPVGASAYTVVKRATPPVAVDHRLDPKVTVRDHRAVPKQPTVIDHRAQPTVIDHRTGTTTTVARGGTTVTYTPRKKKVVPPPAPYVGGVMGGGPSM